MGPPELGLGSSKLVQERLHLLACGRRELGGGGVHSITLMRRCNKRLSPTKGQGPVLSLELSIALVPTDLEAH